MTSRNVFWPDAESRRALRLAAERTGEKATYPPRPEKPDSWKAVFYIPLTAGALIALVKLAAIIFFGSTS